MYSSACICGDVNLQIAPNFHMIQEILAIRTSLPSTIIIYVKSFDFILLYMVKRSVTDGQMLANRFGIRLCFVHYFSASLPRPPPPPLLPFPRPIYIWHAPNNSNNNICKKHMKERCELIFHFGCSFYMHYI